MTTHVVYLNSIRTAKRQQRTAHARRFVAYNLDLGYHGFAELVSEGWYRFYPHATHQGWLAEAAALVLGPRVQPSGRPW